MPAEPPKIGDRTVREVFQQSVRKVVRSRALKSAYGIGEQKALKLRAMQDAAAQPLASPIAVKCALKAEGMETPDIDLILTTDELLIAVATISDQFVEQSQEAFIDADMMRLARASAPAQLFDDASFVTLLGQWGEEAEKRRVAKIRSTIASLGRDRLSLHGVWELACNRAAWPDLLGATALLAGVIGALGDREPGIAKTALRALWHLVENAGDAARQLLVELELLEALTTHRSNPALLALDDDRDEPVVAWASCVLGLAARDAAWQERFCACGGLHTMAALVDDGLAAHSRRSRELIAHALVRLAGTRSAVHRARLMQLARDGTLLRLVRNTGAHEVVAYVFSAATSDRAGLRAIEAAGARPIFIGLVDAASKLLQRAQQRDSTRHELQPRPTPPNRRSAAPQRPRHDRAKADECISLMHQLECLSMALWACSTLLGEVRGVGARFAPLPSAHHCLTNARSLASNVHRLTPSANALARGA